MEDLKKLFTEAKGGYLPIPKKLSLAIGAKAAIFITELCDKYVYHKKSNTLNEDGEFYLTIADVQADTGLTKREQASIVTKLEQENLFTTISKSTPGALKRVRYFKLDTKIDEKLIKIMEGAKDKAEEISSQNTKEVERCEKLSADMEVIKCTHGKEQNVTTGSDKMLPLEGTKCNVNKNRKKEQNIKTEQKEESLTLCLSDSKKDKNYDYLIDELSSKLDVNKETISKVIEKASNDTKHSYKDLKLSYEFKEKTIDWLLEVRTKKIPFSNDTHKINTIVSSIKNGIDEALANQKEEQAEYEEMNANNSQIIDFHAQQIAMEKAMKAKEDVIIEDTIDFDVLKDNIIEECKKEDTKINTNSTSFMDFLDEAEKKQA